MGKFNLYTHIRSIFNWAWQGDTNLAILDTIVEGAFDTTNEALSAKEADVNERAGYSIQRLSLENSLNAKFDATLARITVVNGTVAGSGYFFDTAEVITTEQEFFVFDIAETQPALANDPFLYNIGEAGGGSATGFIVNVPIEYAGLEREIRAWIEFVMIFGTDYTLIFL